MKYNELKIGQKLWYNSIDSDASIISAKFTSGGNNYVIFEHEEDSSYSFEFLRDNFSLTREDCLLACSNKAIKKKREIKKLFGLEMELKEKIKAFRNEFEDTYVTAIEVETEKDKESYRDEMRKICLMYGMSAEFFDYYTRQYRRKSKEDARLDMLEEAGIYEKF